MNLEFIGWLVAFIIISEIFFVLFLKFSNMSEGISWFGIKLLSLFLGLIFTLVHAMILKSSTGGESISPQFSRLIWEALIIGGIIGFFYINKRIYKWITNENKR